MLASGLILCGLALVPLGVANAAGRGAYRIDGRWVADVPPKTFCSPSRLTLDVKGGLIVGNVVNREGVFAVAGEVDPYGNGTIRIGQVAGVIRFDRNRFVADYPNLICGHRQAVGVRIS